MATAKPSKTRPPKPSAFERERRSILKNIEGEVIPYEQSIKVASHNKDKIDWETKHLQLDYEIRKEKKLRRKKWDGVLLSLVILGFAGSYIMIILIGLNILQFPDNAFAVPSVVAAGIVETYGLARIAARYFFSEDGKQNTSKNDNSAV